MANVLLIDDDPDFLKLGAAQLQARGHTVLPVGAARDALRLTSEVDFIISDVMMEDYDGERFLDEVTRRGDPGVPVLMISSRKDLVSSVRMIAKGAVDLARKPIDWDRVDSMIARAGSLKSRAAEPRKPVSAPPVTSAASGAKRPRVLIVEDSSTQRALWRLTLSDRYADTRIVADGDEALRALDAGEYDLLITDVDLGAVSGYEVATAARRRNAELPVIIISSRVATGRPPEVSIPGNAAQLFCFHKGDRADALLRAGRILNLPPVI